MDVHWASLPNDILSIISDYLLEDADFATMRNTCKGWGCFYPTNSLAPSLVTEIEDSGIPHFLVPYRKVLVSAPEYVRFKPPPRVLSTSSRGYMVRESDSLELILFDPATGRSIQLPSVGCSIHKLVLSGDPQTSDGWTAVAIYRTVDAVTRFSLYKSRSNSWILLPSPENNLSLQLVDVEYFNGRFCLITLRPVDSVDRPDDWDPRFNLFSWILRSDTSRIALRSHYEMTIRNYDYEIYDMECYLVECAGYLSAVAVFDLSSSDSEADSDTAVGNEDIGDDEDNDSDAEDIGDDEDNDSDAGDNDSDAEDIGDVEDNDNDSEDSDNDIDAERMVGVRMHVYRVVWQNGRLEFDESDDLRGHAFFVGKNHSFAVNARKHPGLTRDSIYNISYRTNSVRFSDLAENTCLIRPIPSSYRWLLLAWLLGRPL